MVLNERGEKGDHGQHGQDGRVGPAGPAGKGAPRRALIGFLVLVVMNCVALFFAYRNDQKQCTNAQENRNVLRQLISQGDPMVEIEGRLMLRLKPGDPAYEYYSTHLDEARAAHFRNQEVLRDTVPLIKC